jgi:hypothetical protein
MRLIHMVLKQREKVRTYRPQGDNRKRSKDTMEEEDRMDKENVELSTEDATGKS